MNNKKVRGQIDTRRRGCANNPPRKATNSDPKRGQTKD